MTAAASTVTTKQSAAVALGDGLSFKQRQKVKAKMLMKKYAGSVFLKVGDVRNRPRQERIAAVNLGKFDKPIAVFESGDQFTLNATNTKTLIRSYGDDSRGWVGQVVELSAGETDYQGKTIETVIVKPISSSTHYGENAKKVSASEETEADEMPF